MGTSVRMFSRCDVNVVVGSGEGIAAPVIRDAGSKGLKAISDEVIIPMLFISAKALPLRALVFGTLSPPTAEVRRSDGTGGGSPIRQRHVHRRQFGNVRREKRGPNCPHAPGRNPWPWRD